MYGMRFKVRAAIGIDLNIDEGNIIEINGCADENQSFNGAKVLFI